MNNNKNKIKLENDERIDDLEFKNLKIIQNIKGFCFGVDAVLLSDFAKNIKQNANVLDLGTGTGIIPILLCGKTKLNKIIGIEIQRSVYEIAKKNIILNNLENRFEVINENITNLDNIYEKNSFDAIVTNPPYKEENTGITNEDEVKQISRHEISANLEDFIEISSKLLKDKGEFYIIHRPERIVDLLSEMRKYKIEPKEIRLVFSNKNNPPKMVLVKGVKNAKKYINFRENLYIYDENGNYTDEILEIYHKNK